MRNFVLGRLLAACIFVAALAASAMTSTPVAADPYVKGFTCSPWSLVVEKTPALRKDGGIGLRKTDCIWVQEGCPDKATKPYQGSDFGKPRKEGACMPTPLNPARTDPPHPAAKK